MPAELLSSESRTARRIREAARRDTLSHALLFTGSADALAAARYAAAALQCTGAPDRRPCGVCPACYKIKGNIHPDVLTVRDPDHKAISVEVIRSVRSDAYIRPNEGRRKIYLFPDCSLLTEQDQNVLLLLVEEGPPYAAFLFCAENTAAVLPTLRSRCVEIKLAGDEEDAAHPAGSDLALLAAETLCRRLGTRRGAVTEVLVHFERKKPSREDLSAMLSRSRSLTAAALLELYGRPPRADEAEIAGLLAKTLTKTQMMRTIELLETYQTECSCNVGPGHVLGALAVELEGITFD